MNDESYLVRATVLGKHLRFQTNQSRNVDFKNYEGLPPGSYASITPWWFEFKIEGAGCPEIKEHEGHLEFSKTLLEFATTGVEGFDSDVKFEILIRLFDTTTREKE